MRERLPIDAFWSHQAEAIDLVRDHDNVAIATGTASGKSLCYQAPVAEAATDPIRPGTTLMIFPTKALAHDQLRALSDLELPGLVAAAYDGDCTPEERTWVRRNANVVLTNPEMLHCALLPHHARWATFLMRLRYIVLDELHVFRGVFGTHTAHLLRRLRRVCASYAATPSFIAASATIGEPAELASRAVGRSRHCDHRRRFAPRRAHRRVVQSIAVRRRARVVALRSRRAAHVVDLIRPSIDRLLSQPSRHRGRRRRRASSAATTISPTSFVPTAAATSPRSDARSKASCSVGRLRGVVATTALELGVDIGGLDACVLDGFPGTIASMRQQMGRAGRERQESLAVLVAGQDQLDQWLMAHPTEVITRPPEPAVINPSNPFILLPHLGCAAFELPLTPCGRALVAGPRRRRARRSCSTTA